MKLKNVITSTALVSAIAAIVSPAASYAGTDEKVFPGSACHPVSVGTSAKRMFYSGGTVVNFTNDNDGVDWARLSCPVVRDKVLDRWKEILVRVRDNSSVARVKCVASNYSAYSSGAYNITRYSGSDNSFRGYTTLC